MIRLPPRSTRTDTRFPFTSLFRSRANRLAAPIFCAAKPQSDEMRMRIHNFTARLCFSLVAQVLATIKFGSPTIPIEEIKRSEEHTSELQSLMRISYAVFCLKKKTINKTQRTQYKQ